jgi:hypothetical protein
VDAYTLADELVAVLGDLSIRHFPIESISELRGIDKDDLGGFEIDFDGSYLHWVIGDIHLGASQLLQQVDPTYFADLEIGRNSADTTALALMWMRESYGLRQSDIPGLSDRHVRRLEKGVSRLTVDAAERLSAAFKLRLEEFLKEFSQRSTQAKAFLQPLEDGDAREAANNKRARDQAGNYGG